MWLSLAFEYKMLFDNKCYMISSACIEHNACYAITNIGHFHIDAAGNIVLNFNTHLTL